LIVAKGRTGRGATLDFMSTLGTTSLLWRIVLAERQAAREIDGLLRAENVDMEQWRALLLLQGDAGLAMGELSDQLSLSTSTMTKVIDRLVSNALAYRAPDANDRRKVLIFISEMGAELVARGHGVVAAYERGVEAKLGGQKMSRLSALLEALTQTDVV